MGSRAEGGGRSKGEGDFDAEGGRMVAIREVSWTRNQKLHINSRISISVYSADNNKGWTMGVAKLYTRRGAKDDSGAVVMGGLCSG